MKIDDMTRSVGRYVDSTTLQITPAALRESAARLLPAGTILVSMYGTIGLTKVVNRPMASNQAISALVPPFDCDAGYLYHAINHLRPRLERAAAQTTQPNISGKIVKEFEIQLPEGNNEQRKIAEILDTVDESIRSTERLIAKLRVTARGIAATLLQAAMSKPLQTVDYIARQVTDGDHHTPLKARIGVPLLGAGNVQEGRICPADGECVSEAEYRRMIKRCHPEAGDVLITCSGTVGRVAVVPPGFRCALVRSVALIKVDQTLCEPSFLARVISSPVVQQQIKNEQKQAAQPNLFQEQIKRLKIPVPGMAEQLHIATILNEADTRISMNAAQLGKLRSIKSGLMEDLLTGRVRVAVE